MSKMVKKQVVYPITLGMGKKKQDYAKGEIIELSEENAEIFKARLAEPGALVDDVDPRTKAAEYKKRIAELEAEVEELKAGEVGKLQAQVKALHAENAQLKASK